MRSNEKYKYSIPNLNELLSERNPSSTYTVQVKNETLNSEVSFNKFLLEWSSDGKSAWVQDVEKASESVHKGAGISAYKILGEELAKNGVVFHPSEELYDDGYNLWKQLKREGRAGKNDVANRYSYIPKDNFKSFESLPTNPWETSSLSGVSGDKLDLVRTSTHLNRWSSDGNGSLIITPKEDTEFFSRSTTHFTLNSVVQDHGNNTFSTGKFAVIGSLQDAAKDNIVSGLSPVDTWMLPSEGKISIPNATLIAPDNIEIPERFSGLNVLKYAADEDQKINYSNLTEAIKGELGKRNSPYYEAGAYGWVGKDSATKEEQLKISKLLGSAVALPSIHFASPDENMEELISDTLKLKNYLKEDNFSVNDLPPNQQLFEAKERFNDDLKQVHPKAQSLYRDKFNKAFERTKEELDLWTDKKYPKESVSKLPEGFPLPNGSSTAIPPPISSSVIPLTPSGNVPGMPPLPGTSIPPPIPGSMSKSLSQMSQQEYAEYLIDNPSDPNIKVYDLLTARSEQRGWSSQQRVDLYLKNKDMAKDFTSRMENLWLGFSANKEKGIEAIGASSGWTNFLIGKDSHIKNTDRYKSYATLADPFSISKDDYADFLRGLEKKGYNGQVKFPGTGSRALTSFDNIVMHGSTENDAKISEQFAKTFFGKKVTSTQFGVDSNGASHTQLLADWVEKERKNKTTNKQTPGNSVPPPIPINMEVDTPLDMVGKSSPFNPSISTLKKQYPTEILNALSNTTHQAVDTTKVSGVNTKTSTISNHKKVHKEIEENSVKNFFGANRLKSFDTETTGLNTTHHQLSKRDRIWQVGLAIEGIGGVEEHTNPFFTSNSEGKLQQSVNMSRPYLESSLKHSNGRFSKKAFEDGNFNQFMSMYEKGELSSLKTSLNNTLGKINLSDVVVLQNMNFENQMLKSSLDQGLISKDFYEDIAKRMETVSVDLEGNTQTLFQRPHKVQKLMRQADMMYNTEYLNNLSEDSFQQYRSTVNNAIAEYTSSINNKNRVGAVAVELQDLSKAFLANAANRGLIEKQTTTLGLNVDFLSRAILGTSEKHTALKDSEDTISLFKKMWEMNSELNSGAELSENTLKVLNNIKEQQPEEINKRFVSTVRSVINDFKEKNYTKIGDNLTWYTPEISLRQQVNNGSVVEKLDKISVSQKEKEYNLPKALDNVINRYNRYTDNIGGFDRKNYVNNIVNDFNNGVSFQGIHTKVDNDYFNLKTEPTPSTESIINKEINNSMNNSDNFWSKKTELFGKEMKMKTKATILGGIGAGLATMAFTQRPHPQDERYSNVSEQFYDEQYLGTAFVDFKERNKHYMM